MTTENEEKKLGILALEGRGDFLIITPYSRGAPEAKVKPWKSMPCSGEADGTCRQAETWKSLILRVESLKGIEVKEERKVEGNRSDVDTYPTLRPARWRGGKTPRARRQM